MSKLKVLKQVSLMECYCCSKGLYGKPIPRKQCPTCKGTGKFEEYHYIHILGKFAIDGDTLK
jgi:hypothetical protein